jgi:glycine cleavage system pyridoxal-binding protein P
MDYTQLNDKQRKEMLDTIGVDGIDALFDVFPE